MGTTSSETRDYLSNVIFEPTQYVVETTRSMKRLHLAIDRTLGLLGTSSKGCNFNPCWRIRLRNKVGGACWGFHVRRLADRLVFIDVAKFRFASESTHSLAMIYVDPTF
jgi:hypothetical protein